MLFFSTVSSFLSITIALRSCISFSSSAISSSVTADCGSFTVIPEKFSISTFGKTSYFTVYTKSLVISNSGTCSIVGCEYGRGRLSTSSLKISSNDLSIIVPSASALIESPYFLSRTFAGT